MPSLMLESVYREQDGKSALPLVDLGYWSEDAAKRYEKLREFGIARKHFSREGSNRLLMRVPPTKLAKVLEVFPIIEGSTYWRCTHRWEDDSSQRAA